MQLRHDNINCHVVRHVASGWEFLQLRRSAGETLGGTWGIVRGAIERNETAWQAALRELREETDLTPIELYQLDTVDIFYFAPEDSIRLTPGFCVVVAPKAQVRLDAEHDDHRWLRRDQIMAQTLWPGERRQIEEIFREILDDGAAKAMLRIRI